MEKARSQLVALLRGIDPLVAAKDDYVRFIDLFKRSGYKGRMSVEAYTEGFGSDGRRSVEMLRRLVR